MLKRNSGVAREIKSLPDALRQAGQLAERLAGKTPAVFLDYDGTLTPIVDHPADAVLSPGMRAALESLRRVCTVCIVTGRDRRTVQSLMGLDQLAVAGAHGFDIWTPTAGVIERPVAAGTQPLFADLRARVEQDLRSVEGALVEPKTHSVAVHYRLVPESQQHRVKEIVDRVVAEHPQAL